MSIISRILVVLVLVLALPLVYVTANVMALQKAWQSVAQDMDRALALVPREVERIRLGDEAVRDQVFDFEAGPVEGMLPGQPGVVDAPPGSPVADLTINGRPLRFQVLDEGRPGLAQMRLAINDLQFDRGRWWRDVDRRDASGADETLTVNIVDLLPHGIKEKMVLHVFEERDKADGGTFIGTFRVTETVGENGVGLKSLRSMTDSQRQRLENSRGPFVMYEAMPTDRHGVFAGLGEGELRDLLPAEVVEQVLKHGQPADAAGVDPNDPAVYNGNYERPLQNFETAFAVLHRESSQIRDSILALTTDLGLVQQAKEAADAQIALKESQIAQMKLDLEKTTAERDLIQGHREALQRRLAELEAERERLYAENRELANKIAAAHEQLPAPPPAASPSDQARR